MSDKLIKTMMGQVVSDKMDKTAVVLVSYRVMHPLYKKYVKQSKKFKAHDKDNSCNIGDTVKIKSCNPISKGKTWEIVEILSRAK